MNKAIFLDRDGVLLKAPAHTEKGYVYRPDHISILPGVTKALRQLKDRKYLLLVISIQSVIADGFITYDGVVEINTLTNKLLGNTIDAFYFCPHHPKQRDDVPEFAKPYRIVCDCRKPEPGLLFKAALEHKIDLVQSWMIGDMISDIAAGAAAGCKTVLISSPKNHKIITTAKPFNINTKPDFWAENLATAAELILRKTG